MREKNDARVPETYFSELIALLEEERETDDIPDKNAVHALKLKLCKKYHLPAIPSDPEVLLHVPEEKKESLIQILRLKPMRTASGVSPVAVMTSPADCPHGVCIYCPGGVENDSPQSYTGHEPAALRAGQHEFDPYLQTYNRLKQYREIGHPTDKIDLIIMGGTFPARPIEYQDSFILGCFKALNGGQPGKGDADSSNLDLETAHLLNETASHRCVGLTIETRPDRCLSPEIKQIQRLGGTRVELGVQTTIDHILDGIKRGHHSSVTRESTKLIKDAGLKLVYHMMPGLPGSTPTMDLEAFKTIFDDPEYRPDMLKIYPTLVVKGTVLHEMWVAGDYSPLSTEGAVGLLKEVKKRIPPYVRIQRIQRDIPAKLIEAGVKKSNLRQLVHTALAREGERCHCIRCREAGLTKRKAQRIELREMSYEASGGKEHFLSYEDMENEVLVAYLRLRYPSPESENGRLGRAIVRELRVSGVEVPLGKRDPVGGEGGSGGGGDGTRMGGNSGRNRNGGAGIGGEGGRNEARGNGVKMDEGSGAGEEGKRYQHTGYGRKLLERAENIAEDERMESIIVTSGVGVRPYYRNLGYKRSGFYMEKKL